MTVSPGEARASARKDKNKEIRKSPEWKSARSKFLLEHPTCSWCGRAANTPHHPIEDLYKNYLDMSQCVPFCSRCHFAAHRGLVLCPSCKKHYFKRDNPNGKCKWCMGDTWKELQDKKRIQRNKKRRELQRESYKRYKEKRGK